MALQSGGPTHCKETLPPRQSQLRRTSAVFVITSSPGFVLSPPKKQKNKHSSLPGTGLRHQFLVPKALLSPAPSKLRKQTIQSLNKLFGTSWWTHNEVLNSEQRSLTPLKLQTSIFCQSRWNLLRWWIEIHAMKQKWALLHNASDFAGLWESSQCLKTQLASAETDTSWV